jgi:beta-lactamase class A
VLVASLLPPAPPQWGELDNFLSGVRGRFRGVISYYIEDLQTGRTIVWNENQPLPAASVIKLPIAVSIFEQELAGRLQLDAEVVLKPTDKADGSGILKRTRSGTKLTVANLLELMLQRSDNTATNMLTDMLGLGEINESCHRQGLTATCMPRYIMDSRPATTRSRTTRAPSTWGACSSRSTRSRSSTRRPARSCSTSSRGNTSATGCRAICRRASSSLTRPV